MVATGGGREEYAGPERRHDGGDRKTHRAATVGSIRKRRQEIIASVRCVRAFSRARARAQTRGKSLTVRLLNKNALCKGLAESVRKVSL